jgi:DNA-damage-inducible protein D
MTENTRAGKKGGGIARKARLELEHKTSKKVVTGENFLPPTPPKKRLKGDSGGRE